MCLHAGRLGNRGVGGRPDAPQPNKTLVLPERFAPFFEHRSISTNSAGAVKTHLGRADASPDQKQPFYTAASFVLIHVSLLRDQLLFYLPYIQSLNSLEAYRERVIILPDLLSDKGDSRAWAGPKYKYNETKMVSGVKEVQLTWSHFAEFEFRWRPVSQRVSGMESAMGEKGWRGGGAYGDMLGCNALVKGQDFSSLRLQGGTARILRSEIGSEGSELFRLR